MHWPTYIVEFLSLCSIPKHLFLITMNTKNAEHLCLTYFSTSGVDFKSFLFTNREGWAGWHSFLFPDSRSHQQKLDSFTVYTFVYLIKHIHNNYLNVGTILMKPVFNLFGFHIIKYWCKSRISYSKISSTLR